jgi:nitric oxide reductase activation protein
MAQMGQMPGSDPLGMPGGASTGGRTGTGSRGQQMPQQQPPSIVPDTTGPTDGKLEHDQAKLRNMDRQKQIVADTQKLVALANELQSDVQKSNKDTLSLDVIRKADEIEKLAKSVREKMKGS